MAEPVTEPPVEPAVRQVAGLEIPEDVAVQVIEAFRSIYPTLTEGKDDEAAVRATLVWFITSTLETYQTRRILAGMDATIATVQAQHNAAATQAREKIKLAAARIKEKAPAPTTPTA